MIFIMSLILGVSIAINVIFVWYTRKLIQNLQFGVNNVDELQKLLNEYVVLLEPVANMENYYADPVIVSTISNTKMVIEACKVYKNSILQSENEEIQENQENNSPKEQEIQEKATIKAI